MELKAGYRKVDGKVVPNDWNVYSVNDLITFEGGSQPDKSTFVFFAKPGYVRLIQIRDYKTDKYETYVPINLVRKFCKHDDIMIGRYGPPIFQILKGIEGAYNVALIKAIPNSQLNNLYAYFFLKQDSLFSFVEKLSQRSSGQTGIDLNELKGYPFPLPSSYTEQIAIANALSDADALIDSLQKLIAKKRQIKQGAMQALLIPHENGVLKTGWVSKKFGDIADFYSGGTPSTAIGSYYGGDIAWITSGDLNSRFIKEVGGRITKEGLENSSAKMIKKGTVLIALYGATAGVSAISQISGAINQAILAIEPFEDNPNFLFFMLEYLKDWIIKTYTQGGQPNLSGDIVKSIEIYLPNVTEQNLIAGVLSELDAEIAALETKLGKYKQIKQGMMQNLLTGRIRLI